MPPDQHRIQTSASWSLSLPFRLLSFPRCPLWERNRELSMVENRVAQILGLGWRGGRTKKPVKTLKKIGYLMLFFFSSTKCLHALALISQLVGSQEAPLSPVLLRELQLYKVGGGGNVVCMNCSLPWFGFRVAAALRLCVWQHKGQQNWKASQQVERQKQRSANTAPHGLTNLWEKNCSVHWISTLRGQVEL